jgi:hypothetical protein
MGSVLYVRMCWMMFGFLVPFNLPRPWLRTALADCRAQGGIDPCGDDRSGIYESGIQTPWANSVLLDLNSFHECGVRSGMVTIISNGIGRTARKTERTCVTLFSEVTSCRSLN